MWQWDRRVQGLILLLIAALIFAGGVKYARWQEASSHNGSVVVDTMEGTGVPGNVAADSGSARVGVHVTGAVNKPGVYYFSNGARVVDAVEKAVPLPQADLDVLNLAKLLADGEKIYVPRQGEMSLNNTGQTGYTGAISVSGGSLSSGSDEKVNINTASAEELDARLPGVGPVLAQRIVDYRNTHGFFRTIEDLQNVSGIGSRRYEQIKDLVKI